MGWLLYLVTAAEISCFHDFSRHLLTNLVRLVFHITCMCLDTHRKTLCHSPVKVVYTTKICNDNLHKINEYLLLLSSFVFKVTPIHIAAFFFPSKARRNVTNLTKRKKKNLVLKTTIHTSSLREPNFIPQKYNLRTCPMSSIQHFHLHQKGGASVRKELSTTNGKDSAPQKNCLLVERTSTASS